MLLVYSLTHSLTYHPLMCVTVVEELRSSMNEVKFFRDLLVQQTIVVRNEAEKVAAADTEVVLGSVDVSSVKRVFFV